MKFLSFRMRLHHIVEKTWYTKNIFIYFLWPFSMVFRGIVFFRRLFILRFCQKKFSTPIIVVGNISVGGVGKTPLVIAIAERYAKQGLKVGIVSRGYRSTVQSFPYLVKKDDSAEIVGDEPLLLALRTDCPVVIDPNRSSAVQYIIKNFKPDLIISDDGLQHYKLGRKVEIVVIDGNRGFGNGLCLPVGPLRESLSRLKEVDLIIINGEHQDNLQFSNMHKMYLKPEFLYACESRQLVPIDSINTKALAIAAIGNPDRFFQTLETLGLKTENKKYPDHYKFSKNDFIGINKPIIMTEKDYVKCREFADERMFFLPVSAMIDDAFWRKLSFMIFRRS